MCNAYVSKMDNVVCPNIHSGVKCYNMDGTLDEKPYFTVNHELIMGELPSNFPDDLRKALRRHQEGHHIGPNQIKFKTHVYSE